MTLFTALRECVSPLEYVSPSWWESEEGSEAMDWWQWLLLITGAWFCLSLTMAGLWSFVVSVYRRRQTELARQPQPNQTAPMR
jgi:hypothetical protein